MASFPFSNGHISPYFGNIHKKFPKDAYSEVRFHPFLSKCGNPKNRFCDVITDELYHGTSFAWPMGAKSGNFQPIWFQLHRNSHGRINWGGGG